MTGDDQPHHTIEKKDFKGPAASQSTVVLVPVKYVMAFDGARCTSALYGLCNLVIEDCYETPPTDWIGQCAVMGKMAVLFDKDDVHKV